MTIEVDISVECDRWSEVGDLSDIVQNAITAARQEAAAELAPTVEVSLLFCDDARMRELRAKREEALSAHDHEALHSIRREYHHLNHRLRADARRPV